MDSRSDALKQIRDAADRFNGFCRNITDHDWSHCTKASSWSIADIAEHVTISNSNILRLLKTIVDSPLHGKCPDITDFEVPYLFYRAEEPGNIASPTGRFHANRAAFSSFEDVIAAIMESMDGVSGDLRQVGARHPAFGMLDGIQWLLFTAAHTERHRAQMIGVMSGR